jgi:peptide/nickel transport system permease protein
LIRYILKRLLQFIPSLILITFLGFLLNDYAPVDPAELLAGRSRESGKPLTSAQHESILREERHKLGLDLPMFYFSINANYECDSLERIPNRSERETLKKLNEEYRNWPAVSKYYIELKKCIADLSLLYNSVVRDYDIIKANPIPESVCYGNRRIPTLENIEQAKLAQEKATQLLILNDKVQIEKQLIEIDSLLKPLRLDYRYYKSPIRPIRDAFSILNESIKSTSFPYPTFSFNLNNRYHRWLFGDGESNLGVIRGDFGTSYQSGQKVGKIIASYIGFTLAFSLGGILLAYLISIPLGVYAAVKKNSWFDRVSSVILFLLYSMPSFWLATLLLVCFANPDMFYWFETSGLKPAEGYPVGAGIFTKLWISLPYIILPLICYTYSSLAFLSRTLRVSVLENIKQDYITTARAKGLPLNKVIWRHAFRNSLLPLITVLANVFPYAIGGSVILETVFTLPGMGFETYRAILGQDYPVIMAMLTLTAVLTILGLLVQDILYALADPRISYNRKK